ncbi:hypothetical protein Q3G72_009663 [Acer saccharum]|nr:hypothetical protein Q3G72_009663 [Acer saccharum]
MEPEATRCYEQEAILDDKSIKLLDDMSISSYRQVALLDDRSTKLPNDMSRSSLRSKKLLDDMENEALQGAIDHKAPKSYGKRISQMIGARSS